MSLSNPGRRIPTLITLALLGISLGSACHNDEGFQVRRLEMCSEPVELDFGPQPLRTVASLPLTLQNCGGVEIQSLEAAFVAAEDQDPSAPEAQAQADSFSARRPPQFGRIAPGGEMELNVDFRPRALGPFAVTLQLISEDTQLDVSVKGIGVPGEGCKLELSRDLVDFGMVQNDATAEITVTNVGDSLCQLDGALVSQGGDWFWVGAPDTEELAPGQSAKVEVGFAPEDAGPYSGIVSILANGSLKSTASLAGLRPANGCFITANENPIDTGEAAAGGIGSDYAFQIVSSGTEPCTILDVEGTAEFSVTAEPAANTVLSSGDQAPVEVLFAPSALGARSGLITVTTDESGTFQLPIIGNGIDALPCALSFDPSLQNFGNVTVEFAADATITATNTGTSECSIDGLSVTGDTFGDVSVSTPSATTLSPTDSTTFTVTFAPTVASPVTGKVQVSMNSGSVAEYLPISGLGGFARFVVEPGLHYFGPITEACASRPLDIVVTNTTPFEGRVDQVLFSGLTDPNFELVSTPSLPAMVAGSSTSVLTARMLGITPAGDHYGEVVLQSTGTLQPELRTEMFGRSVSIADSTYTQEYTQGEIAKVDILFVIDDSYSMDQEQTNLANNFDSFITGLTTQGESDWQIGVTTTSVDSWGPQGALVAPYIYNVGPGATTDPVADFVAMAMVGLNGSADELGLEAAKLALTSPKIDNPPNAGFLRDDALLALIFVSDEDDQSQLAVSDYVNLMTTLKNGQAEAVTTAAIVGDVPSGCSGSGGSADAGGRYVDFINAFGGTFGSICSTNWGTLLQNVGTQVFVALSNFQLLAIPDLATVDVDIDGVPVGQDPSDGWSYDPGTNTIRLNGTAIPDSGKTITITYVAECLEP